MDHRNRRPGAGQQRIRRRLRGDQRLRRRGPLPLQGQRHRRRLLRLQQLLRSAQGIQGEAGRRSTAAGSSRKNRRTSTTGPLTRRRSRAARPRKRRGERRKRDVQPAGRRRRPGAANQLRLGLPRSCTSPGPAGRATRRPAAPKQIASVPGQFIAALGPNPGAIARFAQAPEGRQVDDRDDAGLGPAQQARNGRRCGAGERARARAPRASARGYALAYDDRAHVPGTAVRFVERGKDSTHVLGTVKSAQRHAALHRRRKRLSPSRRSSPTCSTAKAWRCASCRWAVTPPPGPSGRADRTGCGSRVAGTRALVSWSAVKGARSYRVEGARQRRTPGNARPQGVSPQRVDSAACSGSRASPRRSPRSAARTCFPAVRRARRSSP